MNLKSVLLAKLRSSLEYLRKNIPTRFYVSVFVIIFSAIGIVWFFSTSGEGPSFPSLAGGSYVGRIEIPDMPSVAERTLYLERRGQEHSLIAVLFIEGWQPKYVPLFLHQGEAEEPQRFKPIELEIAGSRFVLSGSKSGAQYRGLLSQDGALRGTWYVRPLAETEVVAVNGLPKDDEWLRLKGIHRLRLAEGAELEQSNAELELRLDTLSLFSESGGELQKLREARAEALAAEVRSLEQEQERYAERIAELIRELNQLERITLNGRVVSLARRVSAREDKWYSVNWADAQGTQLDEQTIAEEMGVNIRSLSAQLERAKEVRALKAEISSERMKIRKLQQEFQRKKEEGTRPQQVPQEEEKERPWWRRLDTVFGLLIPFGGVSW